MSTSSERSSHALRISTATSATIRISSRSILPSRKRAERARLLLHLRTSCSRLREVWLPRRDSSPTFCVALSSVRRRRRPRLQVSRSQHSSPVCRLPSAQSVMREKRLLQHSRSAQYTKSMLLMFRRKKSKLTERRFDCLIQLPRLRLSRPAKAPPTHQRP